MPRGRPPKPIEQRAREGNPGNRRLPEPLHLSARLPERPAGLPPAAIALWDELMPDLSEVGVVAFPDSAALVAMCVQWARAEEARRVIAEEGHFALGSTGQLVEHPALAIERAAHALYLRFAEQFGLTASARARIAATALGARAVQASLDAELADVIDMQPELLAAE